MAAVSCPGKMAAELGEYVQVVVGEDGEQEQVLVVQGEGGEELKAVEAATLTPELLQSLVDNDTVYYVQPDGSLVPGGSLRAAQAAGSQDGGLEQGGAKLGQEEAQPGVCLATEKGAQPGQEGLQPGQEEVQLGVCLVTEEGAQPAVFLGQDGAQPSASLAAAGAHPGGSVAAAGAHPGGSVAVAGAQPAGSVAAAGAQPGGRVAAAGAQPRVGLVPEGSQPTVSLVHSGTLVQETVVPSTDELQPSGEGSSSSPMLKDAAQQLKTAAHHVALKEGGTSPVTRILNHKQMKSIHVHVPALPSKSFMEQVVLKVGANENAPARIKVNSDNPSLIGAQIVQMKPGTDPVQKLIVSATPAKSPVQLVIQQAQTSSANPKVLDPNAKTITAEPLDEQSCCVAHPQCYSPEETDKSYKKGQKRKKTVKVKTRSGRISRPPKHKAKDYKFLKMGDMSPDSASNSEDDYEVSTEDDDDNTLPDTITDVQPRTVKNALFQCQTCEKSYMGKGGLSRHYRLYPTHGQMDPEPVSEDRDNGDDCVSGQMLPSGRQLEVTARANRGMVPVNAYSNIWNYFEIADDVTFSNCKLCVARISRGKLSASFTTTAMWNHLRNKHASTFRELKITKVPRQLPPPSSPSTHSSATDHSSFEDDDDPDDTTVAGSPVSISSAPSPVSVASSDGEPSPSKKAPVKRQAVPSTEPPIEAILDTEQNFEPGDKRGETITRLITEMICTDNRPLSILADKGFTKLINELEPRYVIPRRKHFAKNVIPEMYEEEKIKVKKLLEKTEFVAATTDMWTSTCCDDYLSLIVHFLDENFEYRHLCLECIPFAEVSRTASAIETFITKTMEEWNLTQKVVCFVRDNSANMVAALERSPFQHLPCLAHTFQLVLKDALLDKTEIKEVMSACRRVVGRYKHSSKATSVFRAYQAKLRLKPHTLQEDEPTKWNSQLHMITRLMEQKQAVILSASELRFQMPLSARQWTIIEELIPILDVFDRATFAASSSQVTVSEIIPVANSTICALQNFTSVISSVQVCCNSLLSSVQRRYQSVETEKLYALGTLLDPRFKGNVFLNNENFEQAKSSLAAEIRKQVDETSLQSAEQSEGEQGVHSMWSYYSELMTPSTSSEPSCSLSPEEEVNAYLAETLLPPSANIFKYWKANFKYPHLRELSQKFLITPPSTIISERLFSTSDVLVDEKRSRLTPERVRMLVFLNRNLR